MLNNLSKETPAGFGSIKTEQLIRADRELFTILSQEHHGTVKPQAGVSPLDARVRALMTDPRITMFMLPLPSSHRAVRDDIDKGSKGDSDKPPKPPKKKAKKARAEKSCPDELKKYKMNYAHGRICWGYNLKDGCSLSTQKHDGKPHKCNRGTVRRLADQQKIDILVKQPQVTLQLRLQRRISLRWKMFHKLMNNHHRVQAAQLITQHRGVNMKSLPSLVLLRRERNWKTILLSQQAHRQSFTTSVSRTSLSLRYALGQLD